MDNRVPMLTPVLRGNEAKYLAECIDTGYVSSVGPFVGRFEAAFAQFVGAQHAVACASGTAALHLALLSLGTRAGSEVLVSDLTFIAPANAARYCDARVTLVDSEWRTWNADPELLVAGLHARARRGDSLPSAVIAVHALGHPALLEPVLEACAEYGVKVVEDAAEALGATWTAGALAGKHVGVVGHIGCFSFNGNKVLTTGGGGMVVTDDPGLAERCRHLSTQARTPGPHYRHDEVGYNYRMTNVSAALGMAQLEQLPAFLESKQSIAGAYDRYFGTEGRVTPPPNERGMNRSAWLYSVLLPTEADRDRVRVHLDRNGIESRPVWDPLHTQLPYRDATVFGDAHVSEQIASRGLSLPSSADLEGEQVEAIAAQVIVGLESPG